MSSGASQPPLKLLEVEISDKRKVEDALREQIRIKQEAIEGLYKQINALQDQQLRSSVAADEVGLLRQRRHLRELCEGLKKDRHNLQEQLSNVLADIERLQNCWKLSWKN
jgi:hypothetical protein